MADEQPYRPGYKGFDEEQQKREMATAERSQDTKREEGQGYENAYVDEGAKEAARRTGDTPEEVESSIERSAEKSE